MSSKLARFTAVPVFGIEDNTMGSDTLHSTAVEAKSDLEVNRLFVVIFFSDILLSSGTSSSFGLGDL